MIKRLFQLQDLKYRNFNSKLIPNVDKETVIGVRVPELRKLAKEIQKEKDENNFFRQLPHKYFEENMLHGIMINSIKEYNQCIDEIDKFLPYVDNWAVCDSMRPAVFKKNKDKLIDEICRWISSDEPYTIRFAIEMLMTHFLDDDFNKKYNDIVVEVNHNNYYVNMMKAWYFATALAKKYEETVKILEEYRLETWVHNKTIQKAVESYRITDEQKIYLKTLRIKEKRGKENA